MKYNKTRLLFIALSVIIFSSSTHAQKEAEYSNMELVGHTDLDGNGDGGEGLALQKLSDGRLILYFAHSAREQCLSIIDVTKPENPVLVNQLPSPAPGTTRCNSLALAGDVLTVANEARTDGASPAGLWVLDVSDFDKVTQASALEDLKLSFYDTSGEHSRGVHNVWFVDGEFAHLATGMPDFQPVHSQDDNLWLTLDLRDPKNPKEVSRWWLPGLEINDECLPDCEPQRNLPFDNGYRPHQVFIDPTRPDRSYIGYIDGGAMIFDISGLADVKARKAETYTPELISRVEFHPPYRSWTHTFQPMLGRQLAWAADEATSDNCADAPKIIWLLDIRAEQNPMVIGTTPFHENDGELCKRAGRFGAHNIHPNMPGPLYANLQNTTVSSWFNGGIRIYNAEPSPSGIKDAPAQVKEIGYYIAAAPSSAPVNLATPSAIPTSQSNNVMVGSDGMIYVQERFSGGLYILKYTGDVPLD